MSRKTNVSAASAETLNVRPAVVRAGLVLAILTAMTAFAVRAVTPRRKVQSTSPSSRRQKMAASVLQPPTIPAAPNSNACAFSRPRFAFPRKRPAVALELSAVYVGTWLVFV